jgi:hypothetical protein
LEEKLSEKITKKDIELLSYVADYRLLTVRQLSALSQRSCQVIRRRLRILESQAIIATRERGYGRSRGRPEDMILLTKKGTEFLNDKGVISADLKSNTEKSMNSPFVDHELLVNWFRIHLLQTERVIPQLSVHYLTPYCQYPDRNKDDYPFLLERIPVDKGSGEIVEFIPDGVFSITDKGTKKALLFFLEVDMGTEIIASMDRGPKDVRQKVLNYQLLFSSGRYKRYESIYNTRLNGFRLLFLSNTATRLAALCSLVQEIPHSDFVWLTDQEKMFSCGLSDRIWARGGRNNASPQSILGSKLSCEAPILDLIR